ncbi:MAG TPA: VCBS repeat-containing protein [Verrucomicrobia bacterium]|nr:VCBS repeat-containing protein [Verrucomicrobiota bacterium]HOB31716.1 VCBS repeat-containing protein [Verrucomicrobiota bacterium]HOP98401.1 VCBS repeat-containing protein [Verrucomicrobiota bacterium]HPU54721.1 VCBS repeat-containing protein [Verrucomicrobiota bacterium]
MTIDHLSRARHADRRRLAARFESPKVVLAGIGALCLASSAFSADRNINFGFTGPEIFPIDYQTTQLRIADVDGDGLNDIVVANNARSKINILYNQTGRTNLAERPLSDRRDINQLPPDARFRLESIASEKRIASLAVADFNSDGRPDIAYYGEPRELIVQYNEGSNTWGALKRWPITDGQVTPNGLATGDLNGDKRTDLVLLGDNCIYFLAQSENQTLDEPQKIPFSGTVKSVQVLDVDGDSRDDLLLVNWEDRYPFRFRLQKESGELGPEHYFSMQPIRSYWADNLELNAKVQVMTVAQNSGRAQISQFTRKPAEPLVPGILGGQFQVLPLNKTEKARRGLLWADINGDRRPDLLVAEPESGQLSVHIQQEDGSLATARTFATLAGITEIAAADWDGDGQPEVFLLSADERRVGVTRLDENQRLPFPTLIPVEGRPLAMAVGSLRAGAPPVLALIIDQEGRSLVVRKADGTSHTQKLSESFKANPSTMAFHDVNQDGLADLLLLMPYERVKVLLQTAEEQFEELDVAPPGGSMERPWMAAVDVDGDNRPELLLPQKNFVRAVILESDAALQNSTNRGGWTFKVKEQINGAASNSDLVAAAALAAGTNRVPAIFLLDAERKALTLCERDATGVWQVARNIELPVSTFTGLEPVAFGGNVPNAIAFLGLNTVAWLPFGGDVWELTELDGYETPIRDGYLNDVVSGDLNQDGRKDLVFLETARNYLDLVIFTADHQLVPANRWPVFEERSFRSRRTDLPEPREAAVADVTGDGKNDLIVLVHDRVLVYPQE